MDGTKTIAVTACREKSNKHRTQKGKNLQEKMLKQCILTLRRPRDRLNVKDKVFNNTQNTTVSKVTLKYGME